MKSEATAHKIEISQVAPRLVRAKVAQGKGLFRIGSEKRHGEASSVFFELNGRRIFDIGNDCDTCHFWFRNIENPAAALSKKAANLPKAIQMPRPVDEAMVQEMTPLLELMEKGDYFVFETEINLAGPYQHDDESSYFFNSEFMEIWDIEDPKEEGLLSGWEHYENQRPRLFRHETDAIMEKQYDFIIPLVPRASLKEEYVKLYQSMIAGGDRPRVLLYGFYQRGIPTSVKKGQMKNLHSFFGGFVLDGHHKLAAYRRAGIPAPILTVLSLKASKYFLLKEEGTGIRAKLEERLSSIAA
ncbi:MAG: hypothetical protein ACYCPQ_07600 [Elusimicrobiota bacterium]